MSRLKKAPDNVLIWAINMTHHLEHKSAYVSLLVVQMAVITNTSALFNKNCSSRFLLNWYFYVRTVTNWATLFP
jgi:hypothetical protein